MSYQGLVNEGATCYLNSLIQTLFMTYQFRQNVYSYVHDPKKISEKDSIPFQLQRLFVNLQTKNAPSQTKDLLKSFQWTQEQAFQQHDVQQFCRILFDAIQASHKNTDWIKQLFGFLLNSYIDCGVHRSSRPQEYLDISLPVRNQYSKDPYSSIEQCLKQYLIPEQLQGVECSSCQKKVSVKKGLTFQSLPAILTIQLNRFELNYQNMQRQKVNSFLYYPEILELYRFLKPHEDIQLKGIPASLEAEKVIVPKEKSKRTIDFSRPEVADLGSKKRRGSDDKIGVKQHVTYLDEQNRDKRTNQQKQLSKQDQKNKNLQILANLKQNKLTLPEVKKPKKVQVDIQDDMLFSTLASGIKFDKPRLTDNVNSVNRPTFQTSDTKYQHQEESFDMLKQYPDGTYALYAVLVHSGGSYGGHYYAYISDGNDWYKFDDSRVVKVNKFQMRHYGSNSQTTNGTNAYLLFYRNVKTFKQLKTITIPSELVEKVKIQNQKVSIVQEQQKVINAERDKRFIKINNALLVKLYKGSKQQPLTIQVEDKSQMTIPSLRLRIKELLEISAKDQNWRLRRYNKSDDSIHQVYSQQLGQTSLEQIGFRETVHLTIQYKTDEQVFQEYDPRKIAVKINMWQPNVIMFTQKQLKTLKILIHDFDTFQNLYRAIEKQTNIKDPWVIRRNYMGSQPVTIFLPENNKDKQLIDLRFFNNIHLYVEERSEQIKTKWQQQFENQRFRCYIKFNNPKHGESRDQDLYFDTRKTLGELKKQISLIVGIEEMNFRIKKGKQLPEMTTFKKKLSDLRFINNQILYIQQGKSSLGSIVVKRGSVELVDDQIEFLVHEELQFQIGTDLATIGDLCRKISQQTGIPAENIRVRQFLACQFKQIYPENDLLQRVKNKSLVWELKSGEPERGYQIYYRIFDIMTFQLGPLKEIFIESTASFQQFTLLLEESTGIQSDRIVVSKTLSSYIDKAALLDCEWIEIKYLYGVVKEEPINLRCDGEIIIIKQAEEAYKPPKVQKKPQQKKENGQNQLRITVIAQKELQSEVKGAQYLQYAIIQKQSQ